MHNLLVRYYFGEYFLKQEFKILLHITISRNSRNTFMHKAMQQTFSFSCFLVTIFFALKVKLADIHDFLLTALCLLISTCYMLLR